MVLNSGAKYGKETQKVAWFSMRQCLNMKASLCVFCAFHWVHWSECLPVPLAYTTKLPAQHYGGVDDAAQWLPSGHYEDQLYEVELQSLAS